MKENLTPDNFFEAVYNIVLKIPKGKVTTYGEISKVIVGNTSKSRTVGNALHIVKDKNIPCHRVVNRNGELSGSVHFETPTIMREFLESEGIEFINGKVNLKKHLWLP